MVEREEVFDLFEGRKSRKFRKHSIYFYQKPRTVTEVQELSGVSRRTIYDHFEIFKDEEGRFSADFFESSSPGVKKRPIQLTHKPAVIWLGERANLTREEEGSLLEFFEKSNNVLRNLGSWQQVNDTVLISIIYADLIREVGRGGINIDAPLHMTALMTDSEEESIKKLWDAIRETSFSKKMIKKIATSEAKISSEAKKWRSRYDNLLKVIGGMYFNCLKDVREAVGRYNRLLNRFDKIVKNDLGIDDPETAFGD